MCPIAPIGIFSSFQVFRELLFRLAPIAVWGDFFFSFLSILLPSSRPTAADCCITFKFPNFVVSLKEIIYNLK